MRTQVEIVGAGPAGLFLSHLLARDGIDCVVIEARSRAYVEGRVRAGVLERGTVDLMHELGAGEQLPRESMIDEALDIRFDRGGLIHINLPELSGGKVVTIYGQQEVVKDLIAARLAAGLPVLGSTPRRSASMVLTSGPAGHPGAAGWRETSRSTCDSSPAAMGSTASAGPQFRRARSPSTTTSSRSAGSASCRNRRRSAR